MAIHLVVFDFMVPTLDSVYQVVLLNSKVAMHVPSVLVQISISSFIMHLNDIEWATLLITVVFITFDIITVSDCNHFCPSLSLSC